MLIYKSSVYYINFSKMRIFRHLLKMLKNGQKSDARESILRRFYILGI